MASRISFKQLGIDDIRPYIGGQVFVKSTEITQWKQDITINTSVVKLKDGNALSKLHEENLKLIQVIDNDDNIVGIAIVKQYNSTTSQFTINALEYGTGKGKFSIYKSLKDLNKTIDSSTFLVFSDIVTTGITINDLDENQLVYDKDGTVARISTIDTSTNSFTVITMTTSGKNFMPIAPDTKELRLKNGGSGYSVGDIVESTTSGVFAEVIDVDANGIILDIQSTTSTVQSTSGTGAIIDYDQVIYGGYGNNWAALSDTAVLVAQALADKFEYETGYDFTIGNAGSGYAIDDIVSTDIPNINVRIVSVGTSGEIQGVEYTRNTVNASGTGASVTAVPNSNIFVIPSRYWNNGTALFSLVNDDGAQVEFYRTGDILEKYNAGADGKIYKFTFNEINGTIKQEATSISASMKEYRSTKQLSTTLEDVTTIRVTDIAPVPSINNMSVEQLVYDAKGTVGKITNINKTTGDISVKTLTLSGGDFMPIAPDTKELKISNPGSGYTLGDIIETTTLGTFAEVTGVDGLGAITSVILSTNTTQSVTGTNAIIDYDQVIYGGYGKNWAALVNASVTNAQVVADSNDFEVGYDYTINSAGTGYAVGDIVSTDIANVFVEVASVGASGEILTVDFTRASAQSTSGSSANISATPNTNIFVIPTDIWNKGVAIITLTNDDGASIQYYRTGDVLTKYNAGANGKIFKFEYDETKGIIKQSSVKISATGGCEIILGCFATVPTTFNQGDKYYNTTDNLIHTADSATTWDAGTTPSQKTIYLNKDDNKLYAYVDNVFGVYGGSGISSKAGNAIQNITGSTTPSENGLFVKDLEGIFNQISFIQKVSVGNVPKYFFRYTTHNTTASVSPIPKTEINVMDLFQNLDTNMDASSYDLTSNGYVELKKGITYEINYQLLSNSTGRSYKIYDEDGNVVGSRGFMCNGQDTTNNFSDSSIRAVYTPIKDIKIFFKVLSGKTTADLYTDCSYIYIREMNPIQIDPLQYVNTRDGIEDAPVGHIISTMANNAPKHYLACDGSTYNIVDYPYLTQHFQAEFGAIDYFGGDGVTTFAVPDLRGEFLRGTGTNSHTNQGDGGAVGEHQDATENPQIFVYNGTLQYVMDEDGGSGYNLPEKMDKAFGIRKSSRWTNVGTLDDDDYNTSLKYTARPTNTSVLYCIKYEPTYYMNVSGYEEVKELLDTPRSYANATTSPGALAQSDSITLADSIDNYDKIELSVVIEDTSTNRTFYQNIISFRKEDISYTTSGTVGDRSYQAEIHTITQEGLWVANLVFNFRDNKTIDIVRTGIITPIGNPGVWNHIKLTRITGIKNTSTASSGGSAALNTYSTTITGNSTDNMFTINHNLNTMKLSTSVYDTSTYEEVAYELKRIDANTVKISWGNSIPTGTSYQVDILGW